MAKAKFILIDYENVHSFTPADLSVLKAEEVRVKLNVKKELSEEQVLELIGALSKSGFVQISGNKVSYNLTGRVEAVNDAALPGQGGLAPHEA